MIWPFNRKRKTVVFIKPNETWHIGDMAEQIHNLVDAETGKPTGRIGYRGIVTEIAGNGYINNDMSVRLVGLKVTGIPGLCVAAAFRKIVDPGVEEPRRLSAPTPARRKELVP